MPSFKTKWLLALFSFLGSIWRLLYWLSYLLILLFDLWQVRWKDWGVMRTNKGVKSQKKLRVNRKPSANLDSLSESVKNTNSVNMTPLLLFHATYFLITFVSLFDINFRPAVTQSNLGLHNAVHHNYFFIAPENHLQERKYAYEAYQKHTKFEKGGVECGFWGQGSKGKPFSLFGISSFKEKYYGNKFKQDEYFKE